MEIKLSGSIAEEFEARTELLLNRSGSHEPPAGAIFFEADGTISSMLGSGEFLGDDANSVAFAIDYVHFAFDRVDWMLEYTTSIIKTEKEKEKEKEKKGPSLTLIKGGLDETKE